MAGGGRSDRKGHDLAAVLLGHPPDEVEPGPGEPVPVGNHNTELIAAMESRASRRVSRNDTLAVL